MGTLPLRTATHEDASAIDALVQSAYAKWVPIIGRKPSPMVVDYEQAVREHAFSLFEEDGKLLALIEMKAGDDHLLIINIAVAEAAQGRGLGSALLRHAEDEARKQGLNELRLYAHSLMAKNRALYERRGYVHYRTDVIADGTVIHLRKRID